MILVPRFKSHFRIRRAAPDLVFFLGETGYRVLQSRLIFELAPLMNGIHSVSEIADRLKGRIKRFDVECGIFMLESEGLILDASEAPRQSGLDVLRDLLEITPKQFHRRLRKSTVRVLSFGDIPIDPFVLALKQLGIRTAQDSVHAVVLVDDYLRDELHAFNREAIRRKTSWMLAKPTGHVLWLGPVFKPGRTACWRCLAQRLKQNREAEFLLNQIADSDSLPSVPSVFDASLHLAAVETLKWLTTQNRTTGRLELTTLDTKNMKMEKHIVLKLADCSECSPSPGDMRLPEPLVLRSHRKTFTQDGGHRSCSPELTYETHRHHISSITGIVDQVESYGSDANGLVHSYVAGHLFVPVSGLDEWLDRGLKQTSAGKGMSEQQAKTGALCEALERYSGVFRGDEYRVTATYEELGDAAIHPNRCMNYSRKQYRERKTSADRIPAPFQEGTRVEWTPAWSLTHGCFRYLPTAYCYYGYPRSLQHDFCRADSNGNAAGNTIEEAILQGFMELVERDCAAVWWFNRTPRPAVNLESFGLPYFESLKKYYRRIGMRVWVLDITGDFGIPSFAALSTPKQPGQSKFLLGLGAHFDPLVALSRALTEMNQFLKGFLSGGSKRILHPRNKDLRFLEPDPSSAATTPLKFQRVDSIDLSKDVRTCVKLAESRGLETLVLDQTRSDVGLPVVKVFVPGLRQLWPRFGKGRLFDIPVQLEWLKKALREEQLNSDRIVL